MSTMPTLPTLPTLPGVPTVLDAMHFWSGLLQGSLRSFTQPILPGWTFNIDSNNSSSPQTEADVVAQFSYGKQLGRINEALAWLVEHRDASPDAAEFHDFIEMKAKIDEEKASSAQRRVERVIADLRLLKASKSPEYERMVTALRSEIDS